jgi:hypothetical protein
MHRYLIFWGTVFIIADLRFYSNGYFYMTELDFLKRQMPNYPCSFIFVSPPPSDVLVFKLFVYSHPAALAHWVFYRSGYTPPYPPPGREKAGLFTANFTNYPGRAGWEIIPPGRYEPGTLFTEFRRDMVYRLRYRWEVHVYALEGDMSDETESSNDR